MVYRNRVDSLLMGASDIDIEGLAEMMGVDTEDPEQMGAFFKKVIGKIKEAVQKRRQARQASGQSAGYGVTVPAGTMSVSERGDVSFLSPSQVTTQEAIPQAKMEISPLMIAAGAALLLVLLVKK